MRLPLLLALAALPAPALANGAFPDTGQVLLPADRPQAVLLGTNFGLVISEDGGGHWRWTCEHGDATGGYRYTLSTDQRRLIALAGRVVVVSEDLGCTWTTLPGVKDTYPFDFFPEADPAFALVLSEDLQTRTDYLARVDLRDASATAQILYRAPMDEQLITVETARSDPRIIYATLDPSIASGRTRMVHSTDGGLGWAVEPIETPPEFVELQIAAVDPRDPRKLYFRAGTAMGQGEALLVSEDGGTTAHPLFTTPGALAGFLLLSDGGALLSTLELGVGRLYRLEAGAFVEVPAHLGARGFAERAGLIYAATDNVADGFAVARSRDRGLTWERVMAFADIGEISRCGDLPAVCTASCSMLVMRGAVSAALCTPATPLPADASPDAGPAPFSSGCSCRMGSTTTTTTTTTLVLLVGLWVRRGRGGRGPSGTSASRESRRTGGRG